MRRRFIAAAATVSLFVIALDGQSQFRTRSDGVVLDVAVVDQNQPVRDLTASHFEVRDNGVQQAITVVERADQVLDVALVVQPLGSMRSSAAALATAELRKIATSALPGDRLATIVATAPPAILSPLGGLQSSRSFAEMSSPAIDVALWDSLFLAFQQFDDSERRRAVLLITNSDNDAGVTGPREVMALSELRPAQLIVILVDRTGPDPTKLKRVFQRGTSSVTRNTVALEWGIPEALVDLVSATGGRILDLREGESRIAEVLKYLRSQYSITYIPPGGPSPGWHEVNVRLKGTKGVASTKPGYWAGAR